MAVDTRLNIRGAFTGQVGNTAIPRGFGTSGMASGQVRMYAGTGATQANVCFIKALSIASGANTDVDLTSGETDINNVAVNLSKIKLVYLEITSPGTSDYLKLGPQNVTNGNSLWFADKTANYYEKVWAKSLHTIENGAGITVDSTNKVIRINNPSAGTLTGYLIVVGI